MKKQNRFYILRGLRLFLIFTPLSITSMVGQNATKNSDEDALFIRKIYDNALTQTSTYHWLYDMCTKIGSRLSGSEGAAKAVKYTKQMMDTSGFSTRLQACMVPHWVRGAAEQVVMNTKNGKVSLRALSIGNSIGTGKKGVEAEVIEVHHASGFCTLGMSALFSQTLMKTSCTTSSASGALPVMRSEKR